MYTILDESSALRMELKRKLVQSIVNLEDLILGEAHSPWLVNALKGEVADIARQAASAFATHEQANMVLEAIAQLMEGPNNPLDYGPGIFGRLLEMARMFDSPSLPGGYLSLKRTWLEGKGAVFYPY